MSKNFSEYIKSESNTSYSNNIDASKSVNHESLEKLIDKYSGLSEDQLMREFLIKTAERKKQGNLSAGEIAHIKSTIEPYLNSEQKQNLYKVFELIDNVK